MGCSDVRAQLLRRGACQYLAIITLTSLPTPLSTPCRGATFGCLHGPCTQVYHFTCARALSYKKQLHFSLQSRDMACAKHVHM